MDRHTSDRLLDTCRFCGDTVSDRDIIITDEADDGTAAAWANCPNCQEVVSLTHGSQ